MISKETFEKSLRNNIPASVNATTLINQMDAIRKHNEITQENLAKDMGMTRQYISGLLKSGNCPLLTACILANALGKKLVLVDLDYNPDNNALTFTTTSNTPPNE